MKLNLLGEHHETTAHTLSSLGKLYYYNGKYEKALEYHSRALDIRKKVYGVEHSITARSLNFMGDVYL